MSDITPRLRQRDRSRGRGWVSAGPVRGARTRRTRVVAIAEAAGGVALERAAEALVAARVRCADTLQRSARNGGWGADTRVLWHEEWAEADTFRVYGATGLANAKVWPAMCGEFGVGVSDTESMDLRMMPASRLPLVGAFVGGGGAGGTPTILLAHALIDRATAELLSGDAAELHSLRTRVRRAHAMAWGAVALQALLFAVALYLLVVYLNLAPLSGAWLSLKAFWRTCVAVWSVVTGGGRIVGYT